MKIFYRIAFFALFSCFLLSKVVYSAMPSQVRSRKAFIPHKKIYKKQFIQEFGIPYCDKLVLAAKEPLYIDITQEERYISNKNDWRSFYRKYGKDIDACRTAPLYVAYINQQLQYGCFADRFIKKGSFIGVNTGHLMKRSNVKKYTDYLFPYPSVAQTQDAIIEFVINSKFGGNYTRFINSSTKNPNIECRFIPKNGFWQAVYIAIKDIYPDEQLLSNYGEAFFKTRNLVEIEL